MHQTDVSAHQHFVYIGTSMPDLVVASGVLLTIIVCSAVCADEL